MVKSDLEALEAALDRAYLEKNASSALEYLQKIVAQYPSSARHWHHLALMAQKCGDEVLALQAFAHSLRYEPGDWVVHLHTGIYFFRQGERESAQRQFSNVLSLAEQSPEGQIARRYLGQIAFEEKRFDDALAHYQILRSDECSGEVLAACAACHAELGNDLEALRDYREALANPPIHADWHAQLAEVFSRLGRDIEACEHYQRYLEQSEAPIMEVRANFAASLMRLGQLEAAIAQLEYLHTNQPEALQHALNLGHCYRQSKVWDRARHYYQLALSSQEYGIEAEFALSALEGSQAFSQVPLDCLERLFDQYASYYDAHMQALGASVGEYARVACHAYGVSAQRVLDLGCGTGGMQRALSDFGVQWFGVDVSRAMLMVARKKGGYEKLIQGELLEVLAAWRGQVECIVLGEICNYFGDLSALFALIDEKLCRGGWCIASMELLETGNYQLQASGRYAHSMRHVEQVTQQWERCFYESRLPLRRAEAQWVEGQLGLWRKTGLSH